MNGFRLLNGDLSIGPNGKLDLVSAGDKLLQDLTLWLSEPKGIGPTTPVFGSTIPSMIGGINSDVAAADAEDEVRRIMGLYQADQGEELKSARIEGRLREYSKREVLAEVVSVVATPDVDATQVRITYRTLAGTDESLQVYIDSQGE